MSNDTSRIAKGRPRKMRTARAGVFPAMWLTEDQLLWLGAEWHRRALDHRVDVIRALIDEAMQREEGK